MEAEGFLSMMVPWLKEYGKRINLLKLAKKSDYLMELSYIHTFAESTVKILFYI